MGMMLETTSRRLFETRGWRTTGRPTRTPRCGCGCSRTPAGCRVPFTTGLLVGIGETLVERAETLFALRAVGRRYGGLQEVIVQNFRAKPDTAMRHADDLGAGGVPRRDRGRPDRARPARRASRRRRTCPTPIECRAAARRRHRRLGRGLPADARPREPRAALALARPPARDHREAGLELRARLTVHPEYVLAGEPWLDPRVSAHVAALAGPDGLARDGVRRSAYPGRRPTAAWSRTAEGRVASTCTRHRHRRPHGGPARRLRQRVRRLGRAARAGPPSGLEPAAARLTAGLTGDGWAALRRAEADPAGPHRRAGAGPDDRRGRALEQVCRLADDLRRDAVGDEVTYVVNRNINFTNVCYVGCRFCAFAQRRTDADAYSLSLDEVADRARRRGSWAPPRSACRAASTPSCPAPPTSTSPRRSRSACPDMHVHAFSPMEVINGATRTGPVDRGVPVRAKESGLDTIPGTAAEILDDEVRWVLTKGKLPTPHLDRGRHHRARVGLPSTSTMMYGHVDNPRHWVKHLRVLAGSRTRPAGSPSSCRCRSCTPVVPDLPCRRRPSRARRCATTSPSTRWRRIMLHGSIDNIQTSWVKLGVDGTRAMLRAGADDVGGTLMEETISRMAGSEHGSAKTIAELHDIGDGIGRPMRERTTTYGVPDREASPQR